MKAVPYTRLFSGVAALAVLTVGSGALLAWGTGQWHPMTAGTDKWQTAPLTALLFVFLGILQVARALNPGVRASNLGVRWGAIAIALVAAWSLVEAIGGVAVPWEPWAREASSALVRGFARPMVPTVAISFLLAALALAATTLRSQTAALRWLTSSTTAVGSLIGGFVVVAYLIGAPAQSDMGGESMTLTSAATFLLYHAAVYFALQGADLEQRLREASTPEERATRMRRALLMVGIFLLCGGVGTWLLNTERTEVRTRVHEQIGVIANLKAAQIEAWRQDELHDAQTGSSLPQLAGYLAAPPWRRAPIEPEIRRALEELRQSKGYPVVLLLDQDLKPVLQLPAGADIELPPTAELKAALDAPRPLMTDLRLGHDQRAQLDMLAAVRGPTGQSAGLLVISIDPAARLYPLVQKWPLQSPSAECLLVRRDGDSVLYLSELRHQRGAALQLRRPLANVELLAAQSLHGSRDGLLEGIDYRGVESLGVSRILGQSGWTMIVKLDAAEAYGPVYQQVREVLLGILLTAGLAGVLLNSYWTSQRKNFTQQQLAAERRLHQANERLALVMRHASDVMLLFDDQQRIVAANERVRKVYGYTPDEIERLTARDLRDENARGTADHDFSVALQTDHLAFETMHRRKDGTTFPVEVSTGRVELDGRPHVLSIIRDSSERRAHLREIERLSRLYRVISEINQMLARVRTRDDLFIGCCRVLVESGGFRMAWIGLRDDETGLIKPVASAGDPDGYIAKLQISMDAAAPTGRGPTATAFRENRAVVCGDFLANPGTEPWHDAALREGVRASIALPLRSDRQVIGVLSVYSGELNYWSAMEIRLLENTAEDLCFALDVFSQDDRRKQAEKALKAREEIFSSIVGQAPDAIGLIDPANGRLLEFNQAAHEMLGYTREQYEGFGISDIEADQNPDLVRKNLAAIMASGVATFETHHRHRDGRVLSVLVRARAIQIHGESFITGVWSDITAAKRAESEMRKLTLAIEQSPASVLITNLKGDIEYVNPRFCALTGYAAEEVLGKNPRFLKSGRTSAAVYQEMWQAITQGQPWRGELINRKKDGTVFTEMALITPVHDAKGLVTHYVALKEDISQRKEMENELVLESQMLTNSMDGICLVRAADRRIIWTNQNFDSMYGYAHGELQDQPVTRLNPESAPGANEEINQQIENELRTKGRWAGELRNARKDGSECWSRVSSSGFTHAEHGLLWVTTHHDITERIVSEAKLRQLSSIVEQAPLAIAITGLNGAIEYANPNFMAVTGYTMEELRGQNPRVLKSGLTPPEVYQEMWATLKRGEVWQGELSNKKKNGEFFDELAVIAPVKGPDGRATHYVALKQDITAQKRAGEALRESEQRYRELFDLESDAILVVEIGSGRILQANQAADQAYGWPTDHLESRTIDDIVADHQAREEIHRRLNEAPGQVTRIPEQLHRRSDGTVFPVEIALRAFWRDGQLLAVTAIRDITMQVEARRRLEIFNAELETNVRLRTEEIAARNREMEALLQSIPDMVLRIRADGAILQVQPAKGETPLARFVGAGQSSAPFDSELLRLAAQTGTRALATKGTAVAEAELSFAEQQIVAEMRAAPVGNEEFVVFARDITARKRLEREMNEMLVKEREVSEMKTRFISMTSHEFRTPMAAAMGSVEILANHLDRLSPAKRNELFDRINGSLRRMTEMLDEVLLLNRIDSKRVEVTLAPVNLLQCMRNVVEEIRLGDGAAHQFEFDASGAEAPFLTDQKLLHHILTNLLSNAGRYSPAGTTVTMRLAVTAAGLLCQVDDQGIGVPPADRERIFEPFERGSNVGTRKGTGLGLNIVKRMTALLNGSIAVEPLPAGGSRFTLTLPTPSTP